MSKSYIDDDCTAQVGDTDRTISFLKLNFSNDCFYFLLYSF